MKEDSKLEEITPDDLPKINPARKSRRPKRDFSQAPENSQDGTNYYYPEDKQVVISLLKDLIYALEVSGVGIETALASSFDSDNTTAFTIVLTQSGLIPLG